MANTDIYKRDTRTYHDKDIEELISQLTAEELEELQNELANPDDSMIPPSERCRYRLNKVPTSPYDRERLLEYLENKAKEEKDWDECKPYTNEKRGKQWKPKEVEPMKVSRGDDVQFETEWDDALNNATEEELVDLAAVLGFHGMMNQAQYHHAFTAEDKHMSSHTGPLGVTKAESYKSYDAEPPNKTNVPEAIKKLKNNDPTLTQLNINNIKDISEHDLTELAEALKSNTKLEKLEMSNTRCPDKVAKIIAASLKSNKTLKFLNIESNFVSAAAIIEILNAVNSNQTLTTLKVVNQSPQTLGVKSEMEIANLIRENHSLIKFGISAETRSAQVIISDSIQRNNDNVRVGRLSEGKK